MKNSVAINIADIEKGDIKALSRAISIVENNVEGYRDILLSISAIEKPVIGITGPPGAGKSTLVDALIERIVLGEKKVGILCIDPTSPFNYGALLGDRIRMSSWYNHPLVYIRSLASRGSLGGLNPKIIEITDVMKAAPFDYLIIETVGVGQSEVEIAGLADVTVVTVVPEAGDEVQTMKAGLMEIADIFVVNKADRPDTDKMIRSLKSMLAPAFSRKNFEVPVIKTIASQKVGIEELLEVIKLSFNSKSRSTLKLELLTRKAYKLIADKRMEDINYASLRSDIQEKMNDKSFNLYKFVSDGKYR